MKTTDKSKTPVKAPVKAPVKTPAKKAAPAKAAAVKEEKAATPKKAAATKAAATAKAPAKAPEKAKRAYVKKEKPDFDNILSDIRTRAASFDAGSYQGFLAIQVTLTDLDKVFYTEIKDGKLSIEPYEYYDRQSNIIMKSDNFIKMIDGKLNSTTAFLTGKLKIEGSVEKAKELSNLLKG